MTADIKKPENKFISSLIKAKNATAAWFVRAGKALGRFFVSFGKGFVRCIIAIGLGIGRWFCKKGIAIKNWGIRFGKGTANFFKHPVVGLKRFGKALTKVHWGTQIFLMIFALLVLVPLLWVLMQSFKTQADFANNGMTSFPTSLHFKNYADAWVVSRIGDFFFNSVLVTALSLAFSIVMCVPCAYVLTRFKFPGSKIIFTIIMAGIFINVNFIVTPIYLLVADIGRGLHIQGLTNSKIIVSLINAINSCSFGIYLLSGYLSSLPKGYEEAAMIDGCGYFKTMMLIMIPIALPSIITVILFNFLSYWNEYLIARTFFTKPSNYTISIGLLISRAEDLSSNNFGRMFAGLVIAMLPTVILYCFVQGKLTKGMSIGGLKE